MTGEQIASHLNYWNENYQVIADHNLDEKSFLGRKEMICRFCNKSSPEVTFHNLAHAIPECLDNNKLFSHYECDKCNHEFGNTLEDHFSKYLFPFRVASCILGKKGRISYKLDDNNRIDVTEGKWDILESKKESIVKEIDEHTLQFNFVRQTYKPIMVYKTLVKMAISILPENELSFFQKTIDWLKKDDKAIEDYFGQFIIFRFYAGLSKFPFIKTTLFKKKREDLEIPYSQMLLAFSNYSFQFIVPCFERDKILNGKTINFRGIPTPFDLKSEPEIRIGSGLINLLSSEYKINEVVPIDMYFESKSMRIET